ncbi:MAG: isopenicillin N synthase family oxygenase [Alphaproteobacteria bacterium]|nr:isopenicillin N synthase family oxygenase [Alphaproteobacteria bacterium]
MKSEPGRAPAGALDLTLSSQKADPKRFVDAFEESVVRHGCAFITDHHVEPALVAGALSRLTELTRESSAQTARFALPAGRDTPAQGYEPSHRGELWQTSRKALAGYRSPGMRPDVSKGFRDTVSQLFSELDRCGARMLAAIARFLWLQGDWFDEPIRESESVLQLLSLAGGSIEGSALTDGEDPDLISLILTDGELDLEFRHRWHEERWQRATLTNRHILVMSGTMLQRMTNDILKPPIYRFAPDQLTANPPRRLVRFSIPFRDDYAIRSIAECVDSEKYPDRYPEPITSRDFRQMERSQRRRRQPASA